MFTRTHLAEPVSSLPLDVLLLLPQLPQQLVLLSLRDLPVQILAALCKTNAVVSIWKKICCNVAMCHNRRQMYTIHVLESTRVMPRRAHKATFVSSHPITQQPIKSMRCRRTACVGVSWKTDSPPQLRVTSRREHDVGSSNIPRVVSSSRRVCIELS